MTGYCIRYIQAAPVFFIRERISCDPKKKGETQIHRKDIFRMSRIVFIFSGQGAQTVGMGKDLYEASKAAKAIYDEADSVLGWSVSDVCFNGPAEKLTSSINCQPAIYTTSMACLAAFQEKVPVLFEDIEIEP